jgi:hypothetical protein
MGATINIQVRSPGVISLDQSPIDALNLRETIAVAQTHVRNQADTLGLTDTAVATLTAGQTAILMGVSTAQDHGGDELWDGWRIYKRSELYSFANRTTSGGNRRPVFIAYSKDGGNNLGSTTDNTFTSYTAVFNEALDELNTFYYGNSSGTPGSGTGQTHSVRWGIKLFWSNGNENHDRGALAFDINNPPPTSQTPWPHTQQQIDWFTDSMRGLYDAVHYIDPVTSQRRFPDAYSGSDPTHDAERQNFIADYLHPSAPYHDFVMWSMYPPGRKTTVSDPTYNWPSFIEADWDNNPQGFLLRCYRRTKLAEAGAGHPLLIATGEIGIGDDPNDNTHRPYYAVYGMMEGMMRLCTQYGLTQSFACWWDQELAGGPQNILTSEDPATSPSTADAWRNHLSYNTYRGGTKPASWAGTPRSSWQIGGPGTDDTGTPL